LRCCARPTIDPRHCCGDVQVRTPASVPQRCSSRLRSQCLTSADSFAMASNRGGIVGMMSARISERVMAVLQAQKNPPRRAGLGEGTGLNSPKRAIRNVPINGIFRAQTQDMFFLRSSWSDGRAAPASGAGGPHGTLHLRSGSERRDLGGRLRTLQHRLADRRAILVEHADHPAPALRHGRHGRSDRHGGCSVEQRRDLGPDG